MGRSKEGWGRESRSELVRVGRVWVRRGGGYSYGRILRTDMTAEECLVFLMNM